MDSKTATIAGAIIIAGALIAGSVLYTKAPTGEQEGPQFNPEALRPVDSTDHHLGPADSPVKLVVFTDLECPFCKVFHGTLLRLAATYPQLDIVYRHFPLENLHRKAKTEAQAVECAAKLGGEQAFWNMTNKIFEVTPSNDGLDLTKLPKIAQSAGVTDIKTFTTCLESNETKDRVERDLAEATKTGGSGTPWTVFLTPAGNEIPITGARSFEVMAAAVEEALKEIK